MLKEYLKSSAIAETVQLEGNVILHRQKLSAEDLMNIESDGEFSVGFKDNQNYELEVNGLTVATGRIIRKKGEYFFKVSKMNKGVEK
jgi:Type III flagellar switch regulator (C-ring) FliN C-term